MIGCKSVSAWLCSHEIGSVYEVSWAARCVHFCVGLLASRLASSVEKSRMCRNTNDSLRPLAPRFGVAVAKVHTLRVRIVCLGSLTYGHSLTFQESWKTEYDNCDPRLLTFGRNAGTAKSCIFEIGVFAVWSGPPWNASSITRLYQDKI